MTDNEKEFTVNMQKNFLSIPLPEVTSMLMSYVLNNEDIEINDIEDKIFFIGLRDILKAVIGFLSILNGSNQNLSDEKRELLEKIYIQAKKDIPRIKEIYNLPNVKKMKKEYKKNVINIDINLN